VGTHHPAIYSPLKSLSEDDIISAPVLKAIKKGINIISMHLNLDVAEGGIDACLCLGLGGTKYKILDMLDEKHGYGREFSVTPVTLKEYSNRAKKVFGTNKIITYGKPSATVKKVASFCGGGAGHAEKYVINKTTDADLIVTSDMAHHVIKEILDSGKCVMIIPHYASEEYGFKKYYERVVDAIGDQVPSYYFDDKRFR
jgi:putative NIF3 family GTP cyclohydrolase 1 type 2